MRRIAFSLGLLAFALTAGCKATKYDPTRFAAIETDPKGAPPVAPPGPNDVARRFPADRGRVAKATFKALSAGVAAEGDFAIDEDRGRLPFQKSSSVESRVRSLRGKGPADKWYLVEIRPEADGCTAIVRGRPKVDEAAALVLLDKIEEGLKALPADDPKSKS